MTCIYVNNKKICIGKQGRFWSDKSTVFFYSRDKKNFSLLKNHLLSFLSFDNKEDTIIITEDERALLRDFFRLFPPVHAGGGAVYNCNKRLLMIRRRGIWDLPKGKRDENESWRNCAIREVMEETGIIDVEIVDALPDTLHMYQLNGNWVCKQTRWYLMRAPDQTPSPQSEEEITEAQWFSSSEALAKARHTYASLQPVITNALRQIGPA